MKPMNPRIITRYVPESPKRPAAIIGWRYMFWTCLAATAIGLLAFCARREAEAAQPPVHLSTP